MIDNFIIFLILSLILFLLSSLIGVYYINKKIYSNDIKILKNFLLKNNLKIDDSNEFKLVFINYESPDFKRMDDFLSSTEVKLHVFLNAPTWLYKTKIEKWKNHNLNQTKEFLFEHKYELVIFDPINNSLSKHSNLLNTFECMEALDVNNKNWKGKKAWV
ncbi:hypothetical protein [Lysinibacillus sphaericus]|uniref:Uncharacterized protein n=1 Tax=Lysinibacillus sphaericus OT4b.31 TaxID=1285586 RepID=R7ZI55_LYSSH|nr:hypothetical protein [Lysinibacillus sphaericus]EON73763.1 hypothetical protein H131_03839 [Lysinibacillus sphaericus OT4b.31]